MGVTSQVLFAAVVVFIVTMSRPVDSLCTTHSCPHGSVCRILQTCAGHHCPPHAACVPCVPHGADAVCHRHNFLHAVLVGNAHSPWSIHARKCYPHIPGECPFNTHCVSDGFGHGTCCYGNPLFGQPAISHHRICPVSHCGVQCPFGTSCQHVFICPFDVPPCTERYECRPVYNPINPINPLALTPDRQPDSQTSRLPDNQTARLPDSQTSRQPDFQTARLLDSQTSRQPDFQTARLPDSQTSRQPDFQTARLPDSQTSRQPDFQTARLPDGQTSRQPDFQTARLPDSQTSRQPDFQTARQPYFQTAAVNCRLTRHLGPRLCFAVSQVKTSLRPLVQQEDSTSSLIWAIFFVSAKDPTRLP
ncbi:uncharacterized protein LOC131931196 [Physella acuta]|uniref:uncharacterized protein LOC131931196 n=1 Tax=Physella acuta TaxID=109671 RepID=UPI0027DE3B0B|nr:uncharacterized protein LOC131931196 [Physella acuta]